MGIVDAAGLAVYRPRRLQRFVLPGRAAMPVRTLLQTSYLTVRRRASLGERVLSDFGFPI